MGVRSRHEFTSGNETEWKIDIFDTDYASTVRTATSAYGEGFSLSYKGEVAERNEPFKGSELIYHFAVTNSTDLTLVKNIAAAYEKRFSCLLYKDGDLYWFGHFIADNIEWEDAAYPFQVDLTAVDYLARLKDIPYDNSGTLYTGRDRITEHLVKCLSKTRLNEFFTVATDPFFKTSIDWWDTNHGGRAVGTDPLYYTNLAHEAFYKESDDGTITAMSTYDVLEQILRQFCCRIWIGNGVFNICQINEYEPTSFYSRIYDKEGTLLSSETSNYTETINQTTIARLAVGTNTFYPALREAKITYNHKLSTNLLQESSSLQELGKVVAGDGLKLALSSGHTILINSWPSTSGAINMYSVQSFQIYVLGSGSVYYLGGLIGYGAEYVAPYWTTDNSKVLLIYSPLLQKSGASIVGFERSTVTPELPISGTLFFKYQTVGYRHAQGDVAYPPSGYSQSNVLNYLKCNLLFDNDSTENQIFSIVNTSNGSTPITSPNTVELPETIIGDGPIITAVGHLEVYDSDWELSGDWGEGTDTRETNINELLLQEFIGGQRIPTEIMQAEIYGDIDFRSRLDYDDNIWMCGGVTLSASSDTWSGEWFKIARSVSNLLREDDDVINEYDPKLLSGYTASEIGDLGNIVANNIINQTITTLDTEITAGAVTSLSINTIGTDGLDVGDKIIVINPSTMAVEECTVDELVSSSATSIKIVSHTFTNGMENGAYIVIPEKTKTKAINEGSRIVDVQEKTADYTMTPQDKFISIDASGEEVELTLFPADGRNSLINIIALDISNTITITPDGTEEINGEASLTLGEQYESVWLKSDGSNWLIVGRA